MEQEVQNTGSHITINTSISLFFSLIAGFLSGNRRAMLGVTTSAAPLQVGGGREGGAASLSFLRGFEGFQ